MVKFGFLQKFINQILACVTTVSYRLSINGVPSNILQARKGLIQGDPISSILFVLIMEYLHRVLQGLIKNPNFNFHPKCNRLKIMNLCFADDILLFVRGDHESMRLIMGKMREYSASTGLTISIPKSKSYLGGDDAESKKIIQ